MNRRVVRLSTLMFLALGLVALWGQAQLPYKSVVHTQDLPLFPPGFQPQAVAITPDGQCALVANIISRSLSLFQIAADGAVTKAGELTEVGLAPVDVAISPDSQLALVADEGGDRLLILRLKPGCQAKVRGEVKEEGWRSPQAVAVAPNGRIALVTLREADRVSVLQIEGERVTEALQVAVGGSPKALAISPDGRWALVTNFREDSVSFLEITPEGGVRRRADIPVGRGPIAVAIAPDSRLALVTLRYDNALVALCLSPAGGVDGHSSFQLPEFSQPGPVAITPDGSIALIGFLSPIDGRGNPLKAPAFLEVLPERCRLQPADLPLKEVTEGGEIGTVQTAIALAFTSELRIALIAVESLNKVAVLRFIETGGGGGPA